MVINIDFDGTVVTHSFPQIGVNIGAEIVLKELVKNNHQLILFTMRCDHDFDPTTNQPDIVAERGPYLTHAVNWFLEHDIHLYGVQRNPSQDEWTSSPKSYAHLMIDDSALGCPLLKIPDISSRPFVNWIDTTYLIFDKGLLTKQQRDKCFNDIEQFFLNTYDIVI